MAKQDFETLFGSSISDSKIIMEKVKNMPNCFVGWVESYNADNNTVNIQPAIQQYVSNSDKNGQNYANLPLLANVWVVGDNTTGIQKGDKALCFVLDQKSNAFFKANYDATNSLSRQTFKPLTTARKSITDCVAIILGTSNALDLIQDIIKGTIEVGNAKNVTETINEVPISDIFESDGTTAKFATNAYNDEFGNNIFDTYVPRTFLQSLYFTRTGTLTATLEVTKPVDNANNYLQTTTTNTTLDFNSTQKLVISRTLASNIKVSPQNGVSISLSFACNRNAELEFGARVLVDGVAISSNQAYGLRSYNGNTSYTNVNEQTFVIVFDQIVGVQEFLAGQVVSIEIVTRQNSGQSLITRYFCGVSVSGVDRNCLASLELTNTSINTSQIEDEAVTLPKLSQDVQDVINGAVRFDEPQSLTTAQEAQVRENINVFPIGSIYISSTSTNPATLFGGGWTLLTDRFIIGAGNNYSLGSTGGVTSHSHEYQIGIPTYYGAFVGDGFESTSGEKTGGVYDYISGSWAGTSSVANYKQYYANNNITSSTKTVSCSTAYSKGNVQSTSNMPPYIALNIWRRDE